MNQPRLWQQHGVNPNYCGPLISSCRTLLKNPGRSWRIFRHHQSTQAFTTREDRMPNHNMLIRKATGYQCWVSLGDPGKPRFRGCSRLWLGGMHGSWLLPSGKRTDCYWKWPFIVSFPVKNGDFHSYVNVYQRVSLSKWYDHSVEWTSFFGYCNPISQRSATVESKREWSKL